jgi:hypothetical protein
VEVTYPSAHPALAPRPSPLSPDRARLPAPPPSSPPPGQPPPHLLHPASRRHSRPSPPASLRPQPPPSRFQKGREGKRRGRASGSGDGKGREDGERAGQVTAMAMALADPPAPSSPLRSQVPTLVSYPSAHLPPRLTSSSSLFEGLCSIRACRQKQQELVERRMQTGSSTGAA